jgi:hypothetical protein
MKTLIHTLFLSCLKATELIEKKIHFRLSLKEKIQLKGHKMICSACVHYEKQSLLLEKSILRLNQKQLPEEELEEIKKLIQQKLNFPG